MDPLIWNEFPELGRSKPWVAQSKVRIVTVRGEPLEIDLSEPIFTLTRMEMSQWLVNFASRPGRNFRATR